MNNQSNSDANDLELKVRLTALVMGEVSDFERAQLESQLEERAELAVWYKQLEQMHGTLLEMNTSQLSRAAIDEGLDESLAGDEGTWTLPAEHRQSLLEVIGGEQPNPLRQASVQLNSVKSPASKRNHARWWTWGLASVACLMLCLGYFQLQTQTSRRMLARVDKQSKTATSSQLDSVNGRSSEDISREKLQGLSKELSSHTWEETSLSDTLSSSHPFSGKLAPPSVPSSAALSSATDSSALKYDADVGPTEPSDSTWIDSKGYLPPPNPEGFMLSEGREESRHTLADSMPGSVSTPPAVPTVGDFVVSPPAPAANDQLADLYGSNAPQKPASSPSSSPAMPASPAMPTIPAISAPLPDPGIAGNAAGAELPDVALYFNYRNSGQASPQATGRSAGVEQDKAAHDELALGETLNREFQGGQAPSGQAQGGQSQSSSFGSLSADGIQADSEAQFGKQSSGQRYNLPPSNLQPNGPISVNDFMEQPADGESVDQPAAIADDYFSANQPMSEVPDRTKDNAEKGNVEKFGRRFSADPKALAENLPSLRSLESESVAGLPKREEESLDQKRGRMQSVLERKQSVVTGLEEISAAREPFSTFSLHVSDVSFKLALAALTNGQWPEASKVRVEEFVNAFDYFDPLPSSDERVACQIEQAIHPSMLQRNVLRVSLRTAATGRPQKTPLRLTLLLDNSGSMERPDRRQAIRRAFEALAQQLQPNDQVTLISFANTPRLLADRVSGAKVAELVQIVESMPSEGGTNLEAALQLATAKAREGAVGEQTASVQNRIVLMTDGAVNLGDADPDSLAQLVLQMRSAGIAFDAAGISAKDLNDEVLEALTRQGDGRYYLLDTAEQANTGFADQIAGALRPAAKNVKVQVEFNPERVGNYKLLGFEKHLLKQEDFRNDQVDAAEMAAAEAGVAMYHFEPKPDGNGDIGSVSVRFQDIASGMMVEHRWPIPYDPTPARIAQATAQLRIATTAALFAAKLRGDALGETVDYKSLAEVLSTLPAKFEHTPRVRQLQTMINAARQLSAR